MSDNRINSILIPQVNKLPRHRVVDVSDRLGNPFQDEFRELLKESIDTAKNEHGLNLSVHAAKRIQERQIDVDSNEFVRLKDAIEQLKTKGGKDSLVVTSKAAYIVDVDSKKIVTAIDHGSMTDNVFTKIDSTLFIN
jgi:flagellar operon protein